MDHKKFQIVDILSDDVGESMDTKNFTVSLYGIDEDDKRLICHVINYKPYFYLKIPDNWDEKDTKKLFNDIKTNDSKCVEPKKIKVSTYKEFYGLQWNSERKEVQKFNFAKLSYIKLGDMKKTIQCIKDYYNKPIDKIPNKSKDRFEKWIQTRGPIDCDSNLYESNIHPIIKFIHDTDIDPTGWVTCEPIGGANQINSGLFTECEYEITTKWTKIEKCDCDLVSNYRISAFDIECDSSHGDFPMAQKNFKKCAANIFDSYQNILKSGVPIDLFHKNVEDNLLTLLKASFNKTELKDEFIHSTIEIIQVSDIPSDESIINICYNLSNDMNLCESLINLSLKSKERDKNIEFIAKTIENVLSEGTEKDKKIIVKGDPIIQIGTVTKNYRTGEIERNIIVIGNKEELEDSEICDDIEGVDVIRCKTESELLIQWKDYIRKLDPDFITGYNIFGFDFKYISDRAKILFECPKLHSGKSKCNRWGHHKSCPYSQFMNFGKMDSTPWEANAHRSKKCSVKRQELSSSALGDNTLNYITMDGRILFDIQKEVQKGNNLESYKLDNVAAHFMRGKLKEVSGKTLTVSSIGNLKNGDYISFRTHTNIGEELFQDGKKYEISNIDGQDITLCESLNIDLKEYHKVEWCLNKDDISPQDIFDKHKYGGSSGRAEVAKYCVQDCELCIHLLILLDIIPNNLGMANVSSVPASYIFLRGQGVKVTSVVAKQCSKNNTLMPEIKKIPKLREFHKMIKDGKSKQEIQKAMEGDDWRKPKQYELDNWYDMINIEGDYIIEGYEGAIVLEPTPGIYLDEPVSVLDYASLYPSSIIEKNLSHETQIDDLSLIDDNNWIEDVDYHKITYDNWIYRGKGKGDTVEKILNEEEPKKTCYFLTKDFMQRNNMGEMGIIPNVLNLVLSARKNTRKILKNETNEVKRKNLDGLQLAYKVTANSVYGQLGAKTSPFFKMAIAACTTAIGRERIEVASDGVKLWAKANGKEEPDVIYGDTDSVFVKFKIPVDPNTGEKLKDKEALQYCIDCGIKAGDFITKGETINGKEYKPLLSKPQDLEYEKTFWPFILISKKRYTGDKYEFNTIDCKRTAMGIVLKRRDNAPIVKHVFGNVIEKIMIDKDFDLALNWLKQTLKDIRDGKFNIRYFVISKSLRGYYKNPQQIAHKVLADRMAKRDPGNKPKANDRIPYVYYKLPESMLYDYSNPYKSGPRKGQPRLKNVMQGDRIEHIDYIQSQKLEIDYEFYITNQIMNPVKQVLDLRLDPTTTEEIFKN